MNKNRWIILDPSFSPDILCFPEREFFKKRRHRLVFRRGSYLIKGFRKKLLRLSSPARKEWEIAERLGELSPPRIALGKKGLWEYVVFKFPDKAINLEELFRLHWPKMTLKEKHLFIDDLAVFISRFLQKNIFQPDFHLKNILVSGPPWRFFLVDLHRAKEIKKLSPGILSLQLAYILPPMLHYLTWWEVGRITNRLSAFWPLLRDRDFRLLIQKKAYALMRKHWAKKEKSLRPHFKFDSISQEFQKYLISWQFIDHLQLVKNSRKTRSGFFNLKEKTYFIKVYKLPPFKKWLPFFLAGRAWRAFLAALKLELRGIPTPKPLFFWESKLPWNPFHGFIVYPFENNASLTWYRIREALSDPQKKEKMLFKLTRFLWEMHERGIFHRDAKISNFIYSPRKKPELMIFDLDHTQVFSKELPVKSRLKDLATLSFSLLWLTSDSNIPAHILNTYLWLSGKRLKDKEYAFYFDQIRKRLTKRAQKENHLSRPGQVHIPEDDI